MEFIARHRMSSFIVAYASIFLLLALFGYYAGSKALFHDAKPAKMQGHVSDLAYVDLPRMTVSVSGGDGGGGKDAPRVRLDLSLEIAGKDRDIVEGYEPRITDRLNTYFSTVRPDQLKGPNAVAWLRSELLRQINSAGSPVPVHDLMVRDLVIM